VISTPGLNTFIQRVYKATGMSIVGALTASQIAINSGLIHTHPTMCTLGGLVLGLGGIIGSSWMAPSKYIQEEKNGSIYLKTENSIGRLSLYTLGLSGLGMSAAPLFAYASMINPVILPTSILITSTIFGASSMYAYMKPQN